MTFCSKEQEESEIITKVINNNSNYYEVTYLDGSVSAFYNSDENHLKKLEEKMIKQAKERDGFDCTTVNIDKWGSLFVALTTIQLTNASLRKNILTLACVGFIISLYFIKQFRENSRRLKELKKYKILLENYEEFKKDPNISKLVEFEALYREPVNIFTIDKFSLYDMKVMKKGLKNKEC